MCIKTSKTDPFRVGCTIRVASAGNDLCPVRAMHTFLQARPARHGPIFILSDGSFLTRAHIQTVLVRTFPFAVPGSMGTHSFRIGGASMLCSLGIPDATVQIMGRWSSNAFRRYMHISDQFLSRVHRSGASRSTSFTHIWQPSSGSSMLRTQP